jgi:hypothetical protein
MALACLGCELWSAFERQMVMGICTKSWLRVHNTYVARKVGTVNTTLSFPLPFLFRL